MRLITLAVLVTVALFVVPSTATAAVTPLFEKTYSVNGVTTRTDTFNVPSGLKLLCYVRYYWTTPGSAQAGAMEITVYDGRGNAFIRDTGVVAGANSLVVPRSVVLTTGSYWAGTFTLVFQGQGVVPLTSVEIFAVDSASECQ